MADGHKSCENCDFSVPAPNLIPGYSLDMCESVRQGTVCLLLLKLYFMSGTLLCPDQFVVYAHKIFHKLYTFDFSRDHLNNQSQSSPVFYKQLHQGKLSFICPCLLQELQRLTERVSVVLVYPPWKNCSGISLFLKVMIAHFFAISTSSDWLF